ncbi:MAG: DUF4124 domain-containing protein [Burkholderiales bacterium]|nr:DUF4124 domain-containing protein [Burkholderiales bacterium]MBH2017181.1 DUF4124 domain-containing protein [Burkholderiales bacterium]
MKYLRVLTSACVAAGSLAALLVSMPSQAGVQWKWRDASGVMQYTDRPPPAGTPDSQILSRPLGARAPKVVDAAASDAPAAPASAKAASTPGKAVDPELEARRRKAEDKKAAEQKAEEEKQAKARADNCERARNYERTLQDGLRISRTNAKGEREILDDKGRAEEMQRTQEAIQGNCR